MRGLARLALVLLVGVNGPKAAGGEPLLRLQEKIPLGKVIGRIDHLALDLTRQRLFVAELGKTAWA